MTYVFFSKQTHSNKKKHFQEKKLYFWKHTFCDNMGKNDAIYSKM